MQTNPLSACGTHFVIKCSCGAVIAQCRCPATDKTVTVMEKACVTCKGGNSEGVPPGEGWRR
jgi:hypothetical protein